MPNDLVYFPETFMYMSVTWRQLYTETKFWLFEFKTLVKLANAVLDLLILVLTSAKVPPAS